MILEYDPDADALFFAFRALRDGDVKGARPLDENRLVHYDHGDRPVGVEILNASHGIDLTGLPEAEEIRRALRSLPNLPVPA